MSSSVVDNGIVVTLMSLLGTGDTSMFSSASYDSRRRGRHGGLLARSDELRLRGGFDNLVGVSGKNSSSEDART
jgi:hypothetical protein